MTWTGTTVLTTPRLTLRCFKAEDLTPYAALNTDPEVVEHLGGPVSREYTEEIADWANGLYASEGIGLLAVERTEDATFLGMCGLHHLDAYPDDIEIAWRFAREYWGHGYATEAAAAWLEYGFDVKGLDRVISVTEEANVRSLGVMRRLGMKFDHTARIQEEGMEFDVVVYSIEAQRHRRQTSSSPRTNESRE
jgi:RimJ/RimL family protein N-acetyltransferase